MVGVKDSVLSYLGVAALKILHELDQGMHGFQRHSIIQRGTYTTNRAMSCEVDEASVRTLCDEALLQRRYRKTKGHVHARATFRLGPATITSRGVIDRSIQQSGFLAVAGLSRRQATLR